MIPCWMCTSIENERQHAAERGCEGQMTYDSIIVSDRFERLNNLENGHDLGRCIASSVPASSGRDKAGQTVEHSRFEIDRQLFFFLGRYASRMRTDNSGKTSPRRRSGKCFDDRTVVDLPVEIRRGRDMFLLCNLDSQSNVSR